MGPTLTVSTQIEIAATPAAVRSVFIDFARYTQWQQGWKFEPADSGKQPLDLKPGDGLKVKMNGTSMQPIVMKENSADSFQWEGSLLGLMKVDDIDLVSSDEHQCDLKIAQATLQDSWYDDEVKRAFYFHGSHSQGICRLDHVPNHKENGVLSAWASLGLARSWIEDCDMYHTNCQPIVPAVPSEVLHPSTRFIDTISECLVSLDDINSAPFKFVALSYVWGVDYQLRTTSSTLEDFRRKLPELLATDRSLRLPLTIRDAMDVTLTLGYRYLWVDALCIVQDSPSDLEIQLAQMDRIYGLATLTIVARGGKSSDSGLPGMSSPRNWSSGENINCEIHGTLTIGCWDVLDRNYEKYEEQHGVFADTACYMWRGWTFQEQILSTRTLEFNRRRMVFWCGHSEPAVECGAAPRTDMRDAHHFRCAVRKYTETNGIVPPGEPAWEYMTKDMLISRWRTIREHYSTRHFTYPSDRRKAVLGTASLLRHVIGDIDSSGHVISQLGAELLWYKTLRPGWNESQQPAIKFSYSAVPFGTFPSWSWLSLWPLNWPSNYKPFPAVELQLHDAGASSLLEIRGRTLEMSVVEEEGDGEKDKVKVYYKDGTNAKLEVYLDRSLEAQTVVTCVPIASVIHSGKSMPKWCYGMLLLQNVDELGYRRVGAAFVVEARAGEFLRRIKSDEARHLVMRSVSYGNKHAAASFHLFPLFATVFMAAAVLADTGITTRYWDCCKPSCAWPSRIQVSEPVRTCNKNDKWPNPLNSSAQSACNGGDAYTCSNNGPWVVDNNLAYGFAAAKLAGKSEQDWCCACYELTFTSTSITGKQMIIQVTNTGSDLENNHFDLAIPGGGVGIFPQGCQSQFDGAWMGDTYGGYQNRNDCYNLPEGQFRDGCFFRFDWFQNAQNPTVEFHEVSCPQAMIDRTHCGRWSYKDFVDQGEDEPLEHAGLEL
ncbi:hypothetical protein CFAM422_000965 [Trichoderma lentiforme]|uniref:Cellulase n=1 Tax=Trichoderma lentiforme TaxID=1567552 RepID=A0A9P4XMC6_9HYPO|nr:hypothetical protein CFAM422_000965 [Trichoderma lentiforme]